jgi:hypothetical protein
LGLALVGLVPLAISTPAKAGAVSFNLYVNSLGWSDQPGREARPGPTIIVYKSDMITVNLHSEDHLPHGLYIDYKNCGYACLGDYISPQTTLTVWDITFSFPADTAGTFQYGDQVVAANVGTWFTRLNSPPTASFRAPTAETSWTGGVSHNISIDVVDPNGDPVQVWVNYSYGGGPSQPIRAFPAGANPNVIAWTPGTFSSTNTIVSVDVKSRGGSSRTASAPFEVDSTPPTIASFFPAAGASVVVRDASIQVNWSEPMNRVTAAGPRGFGVRVVDGPWLAGTGTWSADGTRFTFQPTAALGAGAKYEVHVNTSATDHSDPGNPFAAGPFLWTFTAGSSLGNPAPPAPTAVTATPTDGGVEVTWTPTSSPNVAGFHVYRGPSSTGPFSRLTTTSPIPVTGPMKYRDSTAQAGHSYYYTVTAVNATGGESAYAPAASVTVPTYQTPPLFDPFPWAVAGVTLGVILGALYGLAWRRKPA